jgi:hypothetical protein
VQNTMDWMVERDGFEPSVPHYFALEWSLVLDSRSHPVGEEFRVIRPGCLGSDALALMSTLSLLSANERQAMPLT